MDKLGNKVKAIADGGEMSKVDSGAEGLGMGFPGFGVIGMMGLTSAHQSARTTTIEYIKAAQKQLGTAWVDQLKGGASTIRAADEASTVKES